MHCRSVSVGGMVAYGLVSKVVQHCIWWSSWGCLLEKVDHNHSKSLLPGTCINGLEQPKTMLRRGGECLTHDEITKDHCPMQVGGGVVSKDIRNKPIRIQIISSILSIFLSNLPIVRSPYVTFLFSIFCRIGFLLYREKKKYVTLSKRSIVYASNCTLFAISSRGEMYVNTTVCFCCRKCKTHPGPVVHISGNPVDPNKVGGCGVNKAA